MPIRYQDVEMLSGAIGSAERSFENRRNRRFQQQEADRRAELERQALELRGRSEENQTQYQKQNLNLQAKGIQAQEARYKAQGEREDRMEKAYGDRTKLEQAREERLGAAASSKDASSKMKEFMSWMQEGVQRKIIPAAEANRQVRQTLQNLSPEQKALLGDSPWLSMEGDLFKEPEVRQSERVVDPDSGEIIYKENGQMVRGGVDPYTKQKAEKTAMQKLAEEAKGVPATPQPAQPSAPAPAPVPQAPKAQDPKTAEIDAYINARKNLGNSPAPVQAKPQVQQPAQSGQMHGVAKPTSKAEFLRLPAGVKYLNPADGKIYVKK